MSCSYPQEVCTLLLAAHVLGDQISLLNWLGFALCLSGISLHVALKALHSRGKVASSPWLSLHLATSHPLCCYSLGHQPDGAATLGGYRTISEMVTRPVTGVSAPR